MCDSPDEEEIREARGTVTEPGTAEPVPRSHRRREPRPLRRMRGRRVPRRRPRAARQDRHGARQHASCAIRCCYRIRHASHYRRGDALVHLSALRLRARAVATRSKASPTRSARSSSRTTATLYDWLRRRGRVRARPPQQIEFARLTRLHRDEQAQAAAAGERRARDGLGRPAHADDRGLRRRGVTPEAIRDFCRHASAWRKSDSAIELAMLEHAVRDDLNMRVPRVMAALQPLKVVLDELSRGTRSRSSMRRTTRMTCRRRARARCRSRASCGSSATTSWRTPPKKFFRLAPGREVRLRYALPHHLHRAW